MDLFEFTEMLRRRARLVIAGAIVIVGLVIAFGFDYDDGVHFRAKPRAESSIQMAVVPAEFDSLASTLSNSGAVAGTAALYATILSSPETAAEITEGSGVKLLETLTITTTGRDGFIGVKATAEDPEGAKAAALYSFTWLEERLAAPLTIVRLNEPILEAAPESILDDDGEFVGAIRLEASPAFIETATGLWIGITTEDSALTVSLADAGGQVSEYMAKLKPDSDMVISLEDVFGIQLDEIAVRIPPLPEPGTVLYDLNVRLDRGILSYPAASLEQGVGDPELLERHVYVSWQQALATIGFDESGTSGTPDAVGLVLLTEDPVAKTTGARRGPVLMLAALLGGFFVLLALVVAVDTWSRARAKNEGDSVDDADVKIETEESSEITELHKAEKVWQESQDRSEDGVAVGLGEEIRESQ